MQSKDQFRTDKKYRYDFYTSLHYNTALVHIQLDEFHQRMFSLFAQAVPYLDFFVRNLLSREQLDMKSYIPVVDQLQTVHHLMIDFQLWPCCNSKHLRGFRLQLHLSYFDYNRYLVYALNHEQLV